MAARLESFDANRMAAQEKKSGWTVGSNWVIAQPDLGLHIFHVMWTRDGEILYDQILRAERNGGIQIMMDEQSRIAMKRVWRPQTTNQDEYARQYPSINFEKLGRWSYELPRGYSEPGESGTETALREGEEETGTLMADHQFLGYTCDNTALSPQLTTVITGGRDSTARATRRPDPHEIQEEKTYYLTIAELADLQRKGELYCGYTLAALAMLLLQYPELLQGLQGAAKSEK